MNEREGYYHAEADSGGVQYGNAFFFWAFYSLLTGLGAGIFLR
ncbi:hypothetical protein [Dysosmobacter sp. HCP28S3_G4]